MLPGQIDHSYERSNVKKRSLNTQLLQAVNHQSLDDVIRLLEGGADANARCRVSLMSGCHLAAYLGAEEVLGALLAAGADPRARDRRGLQPHHLLAYCRLQAAAISCLRAFLTVDGTLLDSPVGVADDQIPEDSLDSFVHNHDETSELVLEDFHKGETLLFLAAKHGQEELVEELLKRNADVSQAAMNKMNPLDVVGQGRDSLLGSARRSEGQGSQAERIARMLISRQSPTDTTLYNAVIAGQPGTVALCLETVHPFNIYEKERTLLHLAVDNRRKDKNNKDKYHRILEMLLAKGISMINNRDCEGKTPLFLAVEGHWKEDVELLLHKGADVTIPSNSGENVVHLTAMRGDRELMEDILGIHEQEDADTLVNSRDLDGYTPLFKAVEANHYSCVKLLLKYPCRIRYIECNGTRKCTLLHLAVKSSLRDDLKIVKEIVEYFLLDNSYHYLIAQDCNGMTAVQLAALLGKQTCLEYLLAGDKIHVFRSSVGGLDTNNRKSLQTDTALHMAAKAGHYKTMNYLLDNFPELLKTHGREHRSALILAALGGFRDCVYSLLSRGANLADRDASSNRSAIDIIMNYIPEPLEMFQNLLDSFTGEEVPNEAASISPKVSSSTCCAEDERRQLLGPAAANEETDSDNFQVILDFKCLLAGARELEVVEAVSECCFEQLQQQFFLHPLVKSFLFLKWKQVNFLFGFLSTIYLLHVSFVSGLALSFLDNQYSTPAWVCRAGIWITALPVILMVIINRFFNGKIYNEAELYVKMLAITTGVTMSFIGEVWWGRHLASLAVLLVWIQLLLFFATSPTWGLYILMFFEVAKNVFQVLSSFIFLIVGFTFSFYILFNRQHPFTDIWISFLEVLAMMSDFGFNTMFDEGYGRNEFSKIFDRILYLSFFFLIIMVLSNIILGMSVSDITRLEGKSKHLAKQGSFLSLVDKVRYNKYMNSWFPSLLDDKPSAINRKNKKSKFLRTVQELIIYPNRPTSKSNPLDKEMIYELMTIVTGRKSQTKETFSTTELVNQINEKLNKIDQNINDIHKIVCI